ncbi:MAG TPA: CPBP family intramembrane glutamic endopeptidase [Steroidobacteraceae bacterium]|nr:CPBP family intramembrane glutamic endopeptidase [Steroidobacteraceae bacterium]
MKHDRLIAGRIHTLIVLAAVAAWAYGGTLSATRLSTELHPHRVRLYLFGIAEEWLMFAVILAGLWHARTPLSRVIGERWHSRRELLRDIGIAAAFWVAAIASLSLLRWLLGATHVGTTVLALLPRGALEIALWIGVSASAGICEETVFRGYLQRQLMVMTGSRPAGMLLAAAAFGLAHLYQGWRMATVIGAYGLMLGLLAYWRRTVRPGMIAHAWQDALTGVLAALVLRR